MKWVWVWTFVVWTIVMIFDHAWRFDEEKFRMERIEQRLTHLEAK